MPSLSSSFLGGFCLLTPLQPQQGPAEKPNRMQCASQQAGPSHYPSHPTLSPTPQSLHSRVCHFSHTGLFPFSVDLRNSCHKSKTPVREADEHIQPSSSWMEECVVCKSLRVLSTEARLEPNAEEPRNNLCSGQFKEIVWTERKLTDSPNSTLHSPNTA